MKLCKSCMDQNKSSKYETAYIPLSKNRIIFLKEFLTKEVAAELSALLLYYDNESSDDIILYIYCDGGEGDSLMSVYDIMQMIKSPIKTICLGKAYSAAAVLLSAGSKGKRYSYKSASIMIHGIQGYFPIPGYDQVDSKIHMDFLNRNNDNLMRVLSSHTGHPLSKIKEDCDRDLYFNAKQALEYN